MGRNKSLVQVGAHWHSSGQPQQTNYYISSLSTSAIAFAQIIRSHGGDRESLALGKDGVQEDAAL